jgi:hypothetical protein
MRFTALIAAVLAPLTIQAAIHFTPIDQAAAVEGLVFRFNDAKHAFAVSD